jgi:hypothetical protein
MGKGNMFPCHNEKIVVKVTSEITLCSNFEMGKAAALPYQDLW